jgi:GH3 auxin-responsive promoter
VHVCLRYKLSGGAKLSITAALMNGAWLGANAPGYLHFKAALREPRAVQESLLNWYLRSNRQTVFGIKHQFQTIRSAREYQERVPLSTYDDYTDAINRIASGGQDVLTSSRVRLFEPTSGSTRGAKLIPFTHQLQEEIRRAVAPWIVDLARSQPTLIGGPAYWSISPVTELSVSNDSKIPIGFDTDSAYLGGWFQSLVNRTLVQCHDLRCVSDIDEFRRRTLLRLLAARDLRLVSVWHPTFLTLLLEALVSTWPSLLTSLREGLPGDGAAKAMAPCLRRAAELEGADPERPMTIWPELKVISCWGDAQASTLLSDLRERFPNVRIQPKGLIATEAFVSVPFQQHYPLAVRSHFFEFIDDAGSAKFLWELKESNCYSVVVTTGGGLYRYLLRDRIRVTGFLDRTPSIRFIGKEDGISDLYGEKLSDSFIAEILARLLPEFAPETRFSLLAPEYERRAARYVLFIDSLANRPAEFADRLESELRGNPHYAYCAHLGQLLPATIAPIERGSDRLYLAKLQADGARLGNIKPTALSSATNWRKTFLARRL